MKYKDYSIKEIQEEDLKMLLKWRNSQRIHALMLTDRIISWDEHYNWFCKNKANKPARNFIFYYKNIAIGYFGYSDYHEEFCSPGGYIGDIANAPIDAALVLFSFGIEYAFKTLNMKYLQTEVFCENKKALKLDLLLGYKIIGENEVIKNGKKTRTFILKINKDEWDINKFL